MKAAWDWHLPRETDEQAREMLEFAAELGFDTLVVHDPTSAMMTVGEELGIRVVTIVTPSVPDAMARDKPHVAQRLASNEAAWAHAQKDGPRNYDLLAHRWIPSVILKTTACFLQPDAVDLLVQRVCKAASTSDGVALDGFGFQNHYGCWCERCELRRSRVERDENLNPYDAMARVSEDSLVEISETLYEAVQSVNPDAVVMSHLWPPFRPNPYYGWRLRMDYCSQTISWFYKPAWSLQRVRFETEEMKRLEDPSRNRFIPFIGCYADDHNVRSGDRIEAELDIAQSQCGDNLVFCNLEAPKRHRAIAEALVRHLR